MLIIKGIIALAFTYAAFILSDKVIGPLKEGNILQPASVTITAVTISYYLILHGEYQLIVASFIGFFVHACWASYKKKPKTSKPKKPKSINPLNP